MDEVHKPPTGRHPDASWKLQDAEARFSELVCLARTEGSQRVTIRGQDAVVVISAEDMNRLLPPTSVGIPFVAFMESLTMDGLDLTGDRDAGRDAAL